MPKRTARHMVDKVSTGQGLAGRRAKVTPPPAQPRIALLPNERFGLCPTCGHMIDRWDIAEVMERFGPHKAPRKN
jgi:pimeloyl-ACP methyl ester carboxylesterase